MNIEKLQAVRTKLTEIDELSFDMGVWLEGDQECGTTACIAGWTVLLDDPDADGFYVAATAREILGLTSVQADMLFLGPGLATPNDAVKAIDNMIEHGVPRWEEVMERPQIRPKEISDE